MQHDTDMRPASTQMEYNGRIYDVVFNISAADSVCERFDCSTNDIIGLFNDTSDKNFYKNAIAIIAILINEAIDIHNDDFPEDQWKPVTEKQMKRNLNHALFTDLYDALVKCYISGFVRKKTEDADDIGEDPNPEGGAV